MKKESHLLPDLVVVAVEPLDLALAHESQLQQRRLDGDECQALEAQEG